MSKSSFAAQFQTSQSIANQSACKGRGVSSPRNASTYARRPGPDSCGAGLLLVLIFLGGITLCGCSTAFKALSSQSAPAEATLGVEPSSIQFGDVSLNTAAAQSVTLTSSGSAPVTIRSAHVDGTGFSLSGAQFPLTIRAGQTAELSVQFLPVSSGQASGELTFSSNSSTAGTQGIALRGTGITAIPTLNLLSCSSGTVTGAGTDVCTVTLAAAAPRGGVTLTLSSSNSAVKVPGAVKVPSGAESAEFNATVSSVTSTEEATITASVDGMLTSYTLQLKATILALSISPAGVAFGDVAVNTPATQPVILTSVGTAPITLDNATLIGSNFTVSGPSFPMTLAPNQHITLDVGFNPTTAGQSAGKLTISSNASNNGTAIIDVTGTGTAAAAIEVTPASVSLAVGATQQFSASVTGTAGTAVNWTVAGNGCSGTACGTIGSNGLYTAPAAVPSPPTVTVSATGVQASAQSGSSTVTIVSNAGATYYLAPSSAGGNDSNNGLSPQTPWLTPNHSVNCGDLIVAASGNYAPGTFGFTFGKVTGSGHCFAFLQCASFDSCYVNSTGQSGSDGIFVSQSHWAVMGFEVTYPGNSGQAACFKATPTGKQTIIDVAFIDDIANGCGEGGFVTAPHYEGGAYGVDYFTLIADIAYNAAGGTDSCTSGVSIWEPVNYDTQPGTHIFVSQVFAWNNVDPATCAGGAATDGEGIILDTFSQFNYTGQTVVEDSLAIFNGARGIEAWSNSAAPIYIENSTAYANGGGPGLNASYCGEFMIAGPGTTNVDTQSTNNIARTNSATGCGSNPMYDYFGANLNATDAIAGNVGFSAAGHNSTCSGCSGFAFGSNTFGADPGFHNAPGSAPPAPHCSGTPNVIACMVGLQADFVPSVGLASYGYKPPSSTPDSDPLFPPWLCQYSTQLNGLVTLGCPTQ